MPSTTQNILNTDTQELDSYQQQQQQPMSDVPPQEWQYQQSGEQQQQWQTENFNQNQALQQNTQQPEGKVSYTSNNDFALFNLHETRF